MVQMKRGKVCDLGRGLDHYCRARYSALEGNEEAGDSTCLV